jgi:hypothetical protein
VTPVCRQAGFDKLRESLHGTHLKNNTTHNKFGSLIQHLVSDIAFIDRTVREIIYAEDLPETASG